MLKHLRELLLGDHAFTVSIYFAGSSSPMFEHVGVVKIDEVGIVVRDEGKLRAIPWTAIQQLNIED